MNLTFQDPLTEIKSISGLQFYTRKTSSSELDSEEAATTEAEKASAKNRRTQLARDFLDRVKRIKDVFDNCYAAIADLEAAVDILSSKVVPAELPDTPFAAKSAKLVKSFHIHKDPKLKAKITSLSRKANFAAQSAREVMKAAESKRKLSLPHIGETEALLAYHHMLSAKNFDKSDEGVIKAKDIYQSRAKAIKNKGPNK